MDPVEVAPVKALKDKTPTTVCDLCQMLGFLSYYRPFIPNFSCMAKLLYNPLAVPNPEEHSPDLPTDRQENKKDVERPPPVAHIHTVDQLTPGSVEPADQCTHSLCRGCK